ncbi:MAG: colanic acid biosynthesis glycosyltransferase WcaL [Gemmatimonadetes bacterium 13_1_40CM_70_11]|nr:MAG: colanic acid biosynthesis glycosyltransferase WcaL [Gemmatimonadetes bacterium 13_1_40CM_70_11]
MPSVEPTRVGYVVKRYPRYSETFIVGEIAAHEAAGLEVEIFSLFPPNDSHFQDAIARVRAPVHYLPSQGVKAVDLWGSLEDAAAVLPGFWGELEAARGEDALLVHQAAALACEVQRRAIRHLHAHFASAAATVTRLASRFARVPYTFTAHAKDIFHESVRPDDLRRKLGDAAATITVSDYNRDYLTLTYGPTAARVDRVYNGVDLEQFPYESPERRPPRIASVGRLVEKKGLADLVEACDMLRHRVRAFHCEIIGTGPLELALRALIQRRGLEEHVRLLGPRPRSEVIELIRSAAVLAAPCVIGSDGDRDGLPTVLVEAMALGTPCVSTDVTGIPELLQSGESGLVVPQHDLRALAAALERLLTDPGLRVRLAARARRRVEAEFDVRRTAARLRAIFHQASSAAVPLARAVG